MKKNKIKKFAFILVIAFSLVIQSKSQSNLKIGAKAGMNIARLTNMGNASATWGGVGASIETKSLILPHGGAYLWLSVSDKAFFVVELIYSMEGVKEIESTKGLLINTKTTSTTNLHYIKLPIMFKFWAADNFSMGTGPFFGYLIGAYNKMETISGDVNTSNTTNSTTGLNEFEVGLSLDLNYTLDMGLNIGLRYATGLTDVYEDYSNKHTSSVVQLYAGWHLTE